MLPACASAQWNPRVWNSRQWSEDCFFKGPVDPNEAPGVKSRLLFPSMAIWNEENPIASPGAHTPGEDASRKVRREKD